MKAIPGGQYRPLTDEGIHKIHESALTMLRMEANAMRKHHTYSKRQ